MKSKRNVQKGEPIPFSNKRQVKTAKKLDVILQNNKQPGKRTYNLKRVTK
jgi:hypothetical protein